MWHTICLYLLDMSTNSNIQFITAGQNSVQKTAATASQNIGTAELSFWDVLDVINPLQHIPILSSAYRAVTDDALGSVANIVGGALFGGPIGAGVAIASEIAKDVSHEGETATALAETVENSPTQIASNAYKHIRTTTADWLNPNFDQQESKSNSNIV